MKTSKYCIVALLAFAFFLVSCGPSRQERHDELEKSLKSWVGKSETELVAKWGPPSNTYRLSDGSKELTYTYVHRYYGWYGYPGGYRTERGFTINPSGTVIAYRWEGL